jgi:hypothetical protein
MSDGRFTMRGYAFQGWASAPWALAGRIAGPTDHVTTRLTLIGQSRQRLTLTGTSGERLSIDGQSQERLTIRGT